jgi:hypothetical protein
VAIFCARVATGTDGLSARTSSGGVQAMLKGFDTTDLQVAKVLLEELGV